MKKMKRIKAYFIMGKRKQNMFVFCQFTNLNMKILQIQIL